MKFQIGSALLAMALLLPAAALARDNTSRSVDIPSRVVVNHQPLKAGHYKLEWQEPGPQVKVNFVRNGKTVATARGTLKTNDAQVTQDDIVTRKTASNHNRLTEIDFGHQKEAILFPSRS
ncbi:MAG TPA: hypothetical protein VLW06_02265 [Terriglobales bacterium]|nr:hypothetical protein [Terriglobales bacterium]